MTLKLSTLTGRAGWGVADQALSSLTNFSIGIAVARTLGTSTFGAFSIAFATYLFIMNASRGLATDPLVVRFSGDQTASWRSAVAAATGTATVIGGVAGVACAVSGWLLGGETGQALLATGVMLPGLMLQDAWRYAFFSASVGRRAFVNDLVWIVVMAPALLAVIVSGQTDVRWFIFAWGGAAGVAGLYGTLQLGFRPRPSAVADWLRTHHDLGVRYLGENLGLSGARQLLLYGIGGIAGLAAAGAYKAGELLLGPMNIVIIGGMLVAVPEATREFRRSAVHLQRFCVWVAVVMAVTPALWGLGIAFVLPGPTGRLVLGPSWDAARALVAPMTLTFIFSGIWVSAQVGLRAMAAARLSLMAQTIGSTALLIGALVGAAVDDAAGAAWGSAAGSLVAVIAWWWALLRAMDRVRAGERPTTAEWTQSTGRRSATRTERRSDE